MSRNWNLSRSIQCPLGSVRMASRLHESRGNWRFPARKLGVYALVLVLRGRAQYADDANRKQLLGPGSVILVFPDHGQAYGPTNGETWDEIFVMFEGPVFDLWRSLGLIDFRRPLGRIKNPLNWAYALIEVLEKDQSPVAAITAWQAFLGRLLEEAMEENRGDSLWIAQAREILDPRSETTRTPQEAARLMGCSYESFRKRFVQAEGMAPEAHRRKRRLELSAQMLRETRSPLKTIAEENGFYDEFHFSKVFKKWCGMSPREYRRRVEKD